MMFVLSSLTAVGCFTTRSVTSICFSLDKYFLSSALTVISSVTKLNELNSNVSVVSVKNVCSWNSNTNSIF